MNIQRPPHTQSSPLSTQHSALSTQFAPSPTPFAEKPHGTVGESTRRLDGTDQTTGTIRYGADLIPGQADLFAVVVRSEHAHARVLSIDPQPALAVAGVVGVYTYRDVGGTNRQGLIRRDHPVLAEDLVRYRGDAVALVVADSRQAAERGACAVRVEYEPLPVISDIDAALADGAYKLYPDGNVMGGKRIRKGDADAALADADVVVSDTIQTQTVDHAFLDLEAGIARYDGQTLTIHASGQWIHEERRLVALALGLEPEHIRIVQPTTGGAFGGREDISIQIHLGLAALKHLGRTVALAYTRGESMRARHKRHAIRVKYTLGANRDGTLTAAKVIVWSDEGAYASTGPAVMRKASSHATGPYRVPNVYVDVYGVYTNNNPTGAMRGFGACQMAIAYEGMMDRLADKLGLDRFELRRKNLIRPGDDVATGQRIPVATAVECLDAAMARFRESGGLPPQPAEPHLRRGYGMSAICFGLGYGDGFPDCARARVAFDDDGRVVVYTGGVDFGQGFNTAMAQIAADELGLPIDQVRVVAADTALTEESGSSSATRQTYFSGNAVKTAASELKEELLDVAGQHLRVHPHEIRIHDGYATSTSNPSAQPYTAPSPRPSVLSPHHSALSTQHSALSTPFRIALADLATEARRRGYALDKHALFKPRTVCENFETGQSPRAFVTYLFGAHVSQVLVDIETGEVKVERHIACHDVGKAVNPKAVEGQMAGGVAQGIGMALMEEVVTRDGRILNANFTDYILPTIRDVPPVECIVLENDDPGGPFGARGVGEPPLIGAVPAVLGAIHNAIGIAPTVLPCAPERVWRMIQRQPLTR